MTAAPVGPAVSHANAAGTHLDDPSSDAEYDRYKSLVPAWRWRGGARALMAAQAESTGGTPAAWPVGPVA